MPLAKLDTLTNLIASLDDQPNMTAAELKAYFDGSPEELRLALNAIVTALKSVKSGDSGAKNIGLTSFDSSPANVQDAIEWIKDQIDNTALAQVPDGSVTKIKLSTDVQRTLDNEILFWMEV